MRALRDQLVPVRDGTGLAADVFLPDGDGPHPTLVAVSPYGKEIQSLAVPPQPPTSPVYAREIEAGDPRYLTSRGYAHVIADARGIGRSGGTYRGWMSAQEARDGYDLVEWAAAQPWSDGNVGMVGVSYYGAMQLAVAALQPPHLKAIMPFNAPADFYRECTHHGGILHVFFKWIYETCVGGRLESEVVATSSEGELSELIDGLREDRDLQLYPPLWNIALNPDRQPNFFDILANPLDGPFYWERSAYRSYERIKIPFYTGSGWWAYAHMHLRGAFQHYASIDAPRKLYIESRLEADAPMDEAYNAEVVRWYDHWLKGEDTGIMDEPPIRVHVRGAGFRDEHEWPLARTDWTNLHLRRFGALTAETEPETGYPDAFTQQPVQEQPQVQSVDYLTAPQTSDLELIGPAALTLFAAIDSSDTNWMASMLDVFPDGTEVELTRGFLKASHRAVDEELSEPWRPWHPHTSAQPCEPGEIYEYRIELSPLSTVIRAANRIKLSISCLDHAGWPPVDPELGTGHQPWHVCRGETVTHTIFHDRQRPSRLLLPVIKTQ
jgi:predicted acyl esterase